LRKENVPAEQIFVTGNTVIDALLTTARGTTSFQNKKLKKLLTQLRRENAPLVLMTAHRRENFGRPFDQVLQAVLALAKSFPQVHWIYPVHPNPNVEKPAYAYLNDQPNVHLFPPFEYTDLVQVLKQSTLVVTDSGGLQEEAPSLGKPVLVLRHVTERPEAVRAGTVQLVGTSPKKIVEAVSRLLSDKAYYRKMANAVNPYGDGLAAKRITEAIAWYFGIRHKKPTSFGRGK
jgi:UDP-N-acetylglucosamine 2-epimerase (non-hydrolysing)